MDVCKVGLHLNSGILCVQEVLAHQYMLQVYREQSQIRIFFLQSNIGRSLYRSFV